MKRIIENFSEFIKESAYIDYFKILYDSAPEKLKNIIDSTKKTEQSPKWHVEGNVYIHTRLVTNRLGNKYPNNKNLLLSGLFHDLGKISTTVWNNEKESWGAHGHELASVDVVDEYEDWIESMGAEVSVVKDVVEQHMTIKYIDEIRLSKKIELVNNPNFDDILKFNSADFGGHDLNTQPIQDLSELYKTIEVYEKQQEENKIISDKFNGKIIMDKYPGLSGKELGGVIMRFKNHITNEYGDYTKHMLKTSQVKIFDEFNEFMEKY